MNGGAGWMAPAPDTETPHNPPYKPLYNLTYPGASRPDVG